MNAILVGLALVAQCPGGVCPAPAARPVSVAVIPPATVGYSRTVYSTATHDTIFAPSPLPFAVASDPCADAACRPAFLFAAPPALPDGGRRGFVARQKTSIRYGRRGR